MSVDHLSQLSLAEGSRLAELEAIVEGGQKTFVDVGLALREIRDKRLYRTTHATFAHYCGDRWGFSDSRGRQLILAAKTVTEVTLGGLEAPKTEREARALARELREEHRNGSPVQGEAQSVPNVTVSSPQADIVRERCSYCRGSGWIER